MTTFNADALKNTENTDGDNQGAEFEMCKRTENLLNGVVAENKKLIALLRCTLPFVEDFPHEPTPANTTALQAVRLMDQIKSAIEAHDKGMA
jgi:hypothetical protein